MHQILINVLWRISVLWLVISTYLHLFFRRVCEIAESDYQLCHVCLHVCLSLSLCPSVCQSICQYNKTHALSVSGNWGKNAVSRLQYLSRVSSQQQCVCQSASVLRDSALPGNSYGNIIFDLRLFDLHPPFFRKTTDPQNDACVWFPIQVFCFTPNILHFRGFGNFNVIM